MLGLKSTIIWKEGEPDKFGEYLTIRKSRITGALSVSFNMWANDEVMKHGPLPKGRPQGWQLQMPDASDIIAWAEIDDIVVEGEFCTEETEETENNETGNKV